MGNGRESTNYDNWFGQIFSELKHHGEMLTEIKSDIDNLREEYHLENKQLDKRVLMLEEWRKNHEQLHFIEKRTVVIGKGTILAVVLALISSGLIGYFVEKMIGG